MVRVENKQIKIKLFLRGNNKGIGNKTGHVIEFQPVRTNKYLNFNK